MTPAVIEPIWLIVNREVEDLRFFRWHARRQQFACDHRWQIATGMHGLETPPGLRWVEDRSRKPDYRYPGPPSDWVPPELQGKLIPFGSPDNPIAERWLGLGDGIGIHGTWARESIGTAASHGCIRMLPESVIELFDLLPNPKDSRTPVIVY